MCQVITMWFMTTFRAGNGAPWLDLLATVTGRYRAVRVDALETPAELKAWFRQYGLEPVGRVAEEDLIATRETREALHRAAVRALSGEPPAAADQRIIDRALQSDRPLQLQAGFAVRRPRTAAEALARVTRDAVQQLTGPERGHLHACGDETCSGIFIDPTGRRRWCTDQQCGNRARVAAYRARAKQQP